MSNLNRQTDKPTNRFNRLAFVILLAVLGSVNLRGQIFDCKALSGNNWSRSSNCNQYDLTTEEILCLPNAVIKVAFHFEADQLGNNFTCDPNTPLIITQPNGNTFTVDQPGVTSWYAPFMVNLELNRMNAKMSSALSLNGQLQDAKISFELFGNGSCG